MDKASKKKIGVIVGIAYILVIGLLILVSMSFSRRGNGSDTGIFKSNAQTAADMQPVTQTEQERQEEYESREEMPVVTEETFYSSISQFLSSGNFDELDKNLRYWQETYKDSLDESESKAAMIAQYRGDIAFYKGLSSNNDGLDAWYFKTPDTLAACVAYTPIMQKYNAFINQDSVMLPAVKEGTPISLSMSAKTNEELAEIKAAVNRTRSDENAIQQVSVYDMTLHGYPCQFVAVMDRSSMNWMPYSLEVTNGMIDLPTISLGKELVRNNPDCNLDVTIAIPAMISEQPDGSSGNIDYSQQSIPSSSDLTPIAEGTVSPAETPREMEPAEEGLDGEAAPDETAIPAFGESAEPELGD